MPIKDRTQLKTHFEDGGTLTEDIFVDLIDSCYNVADDNSAGSSEVPKVAITLQELYDLPPVAGGGDLMLSSTVGALSVTGDQDILLQSADAGDTLTVSLDQSANEIVISVSDVSDSSNIIVDSSTFTASNSSAASVATIDYGQTIIIGSDAAGGVKIQSDATVAVRDAGDAADQKLTAADPAPSSQEVVTTNYLEAQLVGLPGTGDVVTSATAGVNDDKVAVFTGGDEFHIKETNVQIDVAGNMTSVGTINTIDITALDASVTTNTADIATLNTNGISNLGGFTLAELNAAITDGDVDDDACCRPPCGVAGGDLSDNYPDPKVVAITEQDATPGDGLGNRYPIGEVDPGTYLYVNPVTNVLEGRSLTSITGSVSGPVSSTDNAIAIYDGTSGGVIQNSAVTIGPDGAGNEGVVMKFEGADSTTDPTAVPSAGSLWYQDNVFNMKLDQADPVLQVGQENWIRVKAAENLQNGDVVYISASTGGGADALPKASKAIADSLATSQAIGVATQAINLDEEGFVTSYGLVRGVATNNDGDGTSVSDGNIIYLSDTTAGEWVVTEPKAPSLPVIVGYVVNAQPSQGTILVQLTEAKKTNDIGGEGGFCVGVTKALADQDILQYNFSEKRFENVVPSGGGAGFFVGNTIYVDEVYGNDGSGSGDDPGAAFATIGAAIDSGAASGDIIVVMPGEYPEEGLILPDGVALVGTGGWGQTFIGSVDAQEDILTLGQDCYLNGFTFKVPHKQYITSVALTQPAGTNGIYNINFEGENRSDIYAKLVLTSNFLAGVPGSGDRIFHKTAVTPDGGPLSVDFNYCFVSSLTVGQHTEAGVVEVLIGGTAEETLQNLIAAINDDGGVGQNGVDGSGRYQYNQLGGANTNTGPNPYLTAAFESGSTDTVIFTTTQEFGSLGFPTQLYVIENIADAGSAGSIFPGIPVNDFGWGTSWPPSSNDGDFPGTGASLGTAPYNNGVVSAASYITYALGTAMFRSGGGKTIGANIRVEKGGMEDIFRCDQGVLALEGTHVPFSPGRTVNKLRTTVKSGLNVSANGHPNFSGTSDDFKLDASLFGGNDYTYTFISPLPGVAPAANTINVLIGADLEESLANLIAAVNNAGNAASGTVDPVGGRYFLGTGVGAHDSVVAVPSSGVSGFGGIKFEQRTSGEAGAIPATQIELTIDIASAGPSFDIRSATATLATVTGVGVANEPFVLLAAGRTQFLNFNCGDPNLENAIKVDGGSSDAQPACLVFTPNIFNCTNAIHSDGKYQSTNLLGGRIENVTYGVRVLDGSASAGVLTQAEAEGAKYRISANHQPDYFYPPESAQYSDFVLNYSQETTDTRDASYNIFGQEQLSVGFSERGADTHLGRGAPYQAGMAVLTARASGATNVTLETAAAVSKSGSTFGFQDFAGTSNIPDTECILVGSLRKTADPAEPLKFWGMEIDTVNGSPNKFWEMERWHNPYIRFWSGSTGQTFSTVSAGDSITFNVTGAPNPIKVNFVAHPAIGTLVSAPAATNSINVSVGTDTTSDFQALRNLVYAIKNEENLGTTGGVDGLTYAYQGVDWSVEIEPYIDAIFGQGFNTSRGGSDPLFYVDFIQKQLDSPLEITFTEEAGAGSTWDGDIFAATAGSELDGIQVQHAITGPTAGASYVTDALATWKPFDFQSNNIEDAQSYIYTLFWRDNSKEIIRFGLDSESYWLTRSFTPTVATDSADDGLVGVPLSAYWIKINSQGASSGFGVNPNMIERIKLLESSTAISKNGVLSCTGLAQFKTNLPLNGNIWSGQRAGGGGAPALEDNTATGIHTEPYPAAFPAGGTEHFLESSIMRNDSSELYFQFPLPEGISTAYPLEIYLDYQILNPTGPATLRPNDINTSVRVLPVTGVLVPDTNGGKELVPRDTTTVSDWTIFGASYMTQQLAVPKGVSTGAAFSNVENRIHKIKLAEFSLFGTAEGDIIICKISPGDYIPGGTSLESEIAVWGFTIEGVRYQAGRTI
jgi:hypothetical protein